MSIRDSYEELAKAFYPSIESSGNVYYGQTKKLSVDELFDLNNGGFKAHTEKVDDEPTKFKFCWKLGPLNEELIINGGSDFGNLQGIGCWLDANEKVKVVSKYGELSERVFDPSMFTKLNHGESVFAKYKLAREINPCNVQLNNGKFTTYDYTVTVSEFIEYVITQDSLSPIDPSPLKFEDKYADFFYDSLNYLLYIRVYKYVDPNEPTYNDLVNKPFTITGVDDDVVIDFYNKNIKYRYSSTVNPGGDEGNVLTDSEQDHTQFSLINKGSISIWLDDDEEGVPRQPEPIISFASVRGRVNVSGNINSLFRSKSSFPTSDSLAWSLSNLFYHNQTGRTLNIVNAKDLVLPSTTLVRGAYAYMFWSSTYLKTAPKVLPASDDLPDVCYSRMFLNCTSLTEPPIILAKNLNDNYSAMLSNTNVNKISTLGVTDTKSMFGTPKPSRAFTAHISTNVSLEDAIAEFPDNAKIKQFNVVAGNIEDYYSYGVGGLNFSRNDNSGTKLRVDGSREYTKYHSTIEEPFNVDGSMNQDIYGYKQFMNPTLFKNGIFGLLGGIPQRDEVISGNPNSGGIRPVVGSIVMLYIDTTNSADTSASIPSGSSIVIDSDRYDIYFQGSVLASSINDSSHFISEACYKQSTGKYVFGGVPIYYKSKFYALTTSSVDNNVAVVTAICYESEIQ